MKTITLPKVLFHQEHLNDQANIAWFTSTRDFSFLDFEENFETCQSVKLNKSCLEDLPVFPCLDNSFNSNDV